uniref:uncharacterized protein LOC120335639 n=1 Tax=Styela clava TaxID=7725 RepID=UPI00193AADD7|nr:uncharacterized protein LOC120335639 [Styela clava]
MGDFIFVKAGLYIFIISSLYKSGKAQDLSALEALLSPQPTFQTGPATDNYPLSTEPEQDNPAPEERILEENGNGGQEPKWSKWSDWSTCSSTIMSGFQVRSRVCPTHGNCIGDDVQLRKCNAIDSEIQTLRYRYKYSKKYVEKCKKKKETDKSLSCKLYLENPDLAYDIFRQNSCFFTVNNGQEDGLFSVDNGTTVPIPDEDNTTRSGDSQNEEIKKNENAMFSISSGGSMSVRSDKFLDSTPADGRSKEEDDDEDRNGNNSAYSINVLRALIKERQCEEHCENTLNQATRLWALGTRRSRSADSTIALLKRNGRLTTGIGVMFFEYNTCINNCHSLGITFSMLSGRNRSRARVDSTTQVKTILKSLQNGSGRKRRENKAEDASSQNEVESLCGNNSPLCATQRNSRSIENEEIRRKRRQITDEYQSPCFSSENQVPVREIEEKAQAELFFFESYVQRFDCRKCRGMKRRNTDLFLPKEQVMQQKNNQPAYCRQGFLKRHALFIVEKPNGRYTFNTGEKFSIESRTFEVESHCEIVVRK